MKKKKKKQIEIDKLTKLLLYAIENIGKGYPKSRNAI